MTQNFNFQTFENTPVIGIIRGFSKEVILEIAGIYAEVGFSTIEVTMNTPNVSEIISELIEKFPGLNVGAGTVCTIQDLNIALKSGASFIVTPVIDTEVISACISKNIPIFPGAYTPSEIYTAAKLGATAVKVFPATQLGSQYIKDVLAPLNNVKLIPTGGVHKDNIQDFFNVGSYGVGMGSSLFDKQFIADKDYNKLLAHFQSIKDKL